MKATELKRGQSAYYQGMLHRVLGTSEGGGVFLGTGLETSRSVVRHYVNPLDLHRVTVTAFTTP